MANEVIMIDTSILIDFYRKTDKNNTVWIQLVRQKYAFAISIVTKFEVYTGATESQTEFWDSILKVIEVIPLDETAIDMAVELNKELKRKRKQIDMADLFIAATAVGHNMAFATLNRKHFDRIENLRIIS